MRGNCFLERVVVVSEMSVKMKVRRHSFSSVEEAAKEICKDSSATLDDVAGRISTGGKRKLQPDDASPEYCPEVKRPAGPPLSLAHLLESIQGNASQALDLPLDQCCLPGGMIAVNLLWLVGRVGACNVFCVCVFVHVCVRAYVTWIEMLLLLLTTKEEGIHTDFLISYITSSSFLLNSLKVGSQVDSATS